MLFIFYNLFIVYNFRSPVINWLSSIYVAYYDKYGTNYDKFGIVLWQIWNLNMTFLELTMTNMELKYDRCGTNYDKNILFVIFKRNSYFCSIFTLIQTKIKLKSVLYVLLFIYPSFLLPLLWDELGKNNALIWQIWNWNKNWKPIWQVRNDAKKKLFRLKWCVFRHIFKKMNRS